MIDVAEADPAFGAVRQTVDTKRPDGLASSRHGVVPHIQTRALAFIRG